MNLELLEALDSGIQQCVKAVESNTPCTVDMSRLLLAAAANVEFLNFDFEEPSHLRLESEGGYLKRYRLPDRSRAVATFRSILARLALAINASGETRFIGTASYFVPYQTATGYPLETGLTIFVEDISREITVLQEPEGSSYEWLNTYGFEVSVATVDAEGVWRTSLLRTMNTAQQVYLQARVRT